MPLPGLRGGYRRTPTSRARPASPPRSPRVSGHTRPRGQGREHSWWPPGRALCRSNCRPPLLGSRPDHAPPTRPGRVPPLAASPQTPPQTPLQAPPPTARRHSAQATHRSAPRTALRHVLLHLLNDATAGAELSGLAAGPQACSTPAPGAGFVLVDSAAGVPGFGGPSQKEGRGRRDLLRGLRGRCERSCPGCAGRSGVPARASTRAQPFPVVSF